MQHFRIFEEGVQPDEPEQHGYYLVGTRLRFKTIGDRLVASISIPVQYYA